MQEKLQMALLADFDPGSFDVRADRSIVPLAAFVRKSSFRLKE